MASSAVIPPAATKLSDAFAALPGIGPKLATKLALYLSVDAKDKSERLQEALRSIEALRECVQCGNLSESERCPICRDTSRDQGIVMVVETVIDLLQIEQSAVYRGLYLVLGGLISPLNGRMPQDLNVSKFQKYLQNPQLQEVIIALPTNLEANATALHLKELVDASGTKVKFTHLARGIPSGVGVEYLDFETLDRAITGRSSY